MSIRAYQVSQTLASNVPFSEWGLDKDINDLTFPRSTDSAQRSALKLISQDGVIDEDKGLRARNHFYDPVFMTPLTIAGRTLGETSPKWAIDGTAQNPFSYSDARKAMQLGLTSPKLEDRNIKLGLMFETLGHVVHHIQDMAQPQHVRNEAHLTLFNSPTFDLPTYSRYEVWADDDKSAPPLSGYDSVRLPSPREYWTNRDVLTGIADFTNSNFVSQRRNFEMVNDLIQVAPPYSSPAPVAVTTVPMKSILQSAFNCPRPNEVNPNPTSTDARCSLQGEVDFVTTSVIDNLRPSPDTNPKAAMYSIFNQDLEAVGGVVNNGDSGIYFIPNTQMMFTVNRLTFPDAASRLLPRAVGYSAGLIDYFFRGKIDLAPHVVSGSFDGTFDFKNLGDEPLTGTVRLYYDADDGLRYPVTGDKWPLTVTNLTPGNLISGILVQEPTFPHPAKSGVYMVVFTGTMGAELPIGDGPGAVVAKQVKLPMPEFYWSFNSACDETCLDFRHPTLGNTGFAELSFMLTPELDKYLHDNASAVHVKINGADLLQTASMGSCGPPSGAFPTSLTFGQVQDPNLYWSAQLSANGKVLYTNEDQGFWIDLAPNFAKERDAVGGVNTHPACSNKLTIFTSGIAQNVAVEYVVGNKTLFKFCMREKLSDFNTTLGFTTVLSHLTGVRVADGAFDIEVDGRDAAGCAFSQ